MTATARVPTRRPARWAARLACAAARVGLACALAWCALLPTACSGFLSTNAPEFKEVLLQGEGSDKMLLIDIHGVISNDPLLIPGVGVIPGMTARVRQELEMAFTDSRIRGILLRIDSPGGTLTDSDVIYHSLMEFKRTKKIKIVAAMEDIAASGAFYIAMAADEVYAHPTTVTGSIGVILQHMEYADLLDKLGVRVDPVTSGKYKDIDTPFRHRTPEEQKMLQDIVQHQYEKFLKVVEQGRPRMTDLQVRELADGRIMTAQQAKDAGLIDGIAYLDEAYKRLNEISGFPTNRLVRYSNIWLTGNNIYSNTFPIEFLQN